MWFVKGVIVVFFAIVLLDVFARDYKYSLSKKRDPFLPLVTESGQILLITQKNGNINFILKGIIYSPPYSYAIISDEIVLENGTIDGYTVISIKEKQVVLKKDSEKIILKLEEK